MQKYVYRYLHKVITTLSNVEIQLISFAAVCLLSIPDGFYTTTMRCVLYGTSGGQIPISGFTSYPKVNIVISLCTCIHNFLDRSNNDDEPCASNIFVALLACISAFFGSIFLAEVVLLASNSVFFESVLLAAVVLLVLPGHQYRLKRIQEVYGLQRIQEVKGQGCHCPSRQSIATSVILPSFGEFCQLHLYCWHVILPSLDLFCQLFCQLQLQCWCSLAFSTVSREFKKSKVKGAIANGECMTYCICFKIQVYCF